MKVPFVDLRAAYVELQAELDAAYRRVAASGWYLLGPETEAFEGEFAQYCEARHCVTVGSGLDALALILRGLEIGPGDEVIVPSHTFLATWLAVSSVGARPVPVEPDAVTYNIDPARIPDAITARTKAIIAVHLYGQPADIEAIGRVAADHGIHLIEDAAQAHGARYRSRRVGGLSIAAAFSFYPTKNLAASGDGGAVLTDERALAERVRLLRNYGTRDRSHFEVKGSNSRLDELQAAWLRVRLRRLDEWNARRAAVAGRYVTSLAGLPDLVLPQNPEWSEPVWHVFAIRHPRRRLIQEHLAAAGIATLVHYPEPVHLSGAYADARWRPGAFPLTEQIAADVLSLPMRPQLADPEVSSVIQEVTAAVLQCTGTDGATAVSDSYARRMSVR
ncbi:MAG: DegT/DnrJ/EryC1/StrS family aminotransferase [Actinomycetota bacterium]|nr:DegT/DnrJ/EryC1/StrS family aminotransferase [Actinomycetota bacterium]